MMEKQKIKKIVVYLLSKNIKKAALFGSFVREDFGPKSDIDILIEPFPGMTLVDIIYMESELKLKTQRKIDLMEFDGIRKSVRPFVFDQALSII